MRRILEKIKEQGYPGSYSINSHLDENISLADVSKGCNVSARYLSKVFKLNVNIMANAYISIAKID